MSASAQHSQAQQQQQQQKSCNCDLLLWRNPVQTGKYFGGSLLALLILKKVNLITFFLKVAYTILFTTGSIEFVSKLFLGQGLITKYGTKECPNIAGFIKPRIDEALKQLPVFQAHIRKTVFAQVPKHTFKAAVALFLLHKFFSWFSIWTIVFVGDIFTFTLPVIYHSYKHEIDATVAQGVEISKQKTQEFSQMACEKTKPYLDKVESKLGPISNLVKSKTAPVSSTAGRQTASTTKLAADVPLEPESKAYTSSAQVMPEVPQHEPSTTQEFNVDELSNELKKSTKNLQNELEKNNA
ncbi:BCE_3a_G0011050.mRNA.1.CDS.1 [Saccharomyces cerevisiae]|nr:BCE_3a_G0011050.mRNA.1.CDS.1 [Saccharomyces cerevisiae]CAI7076569.1 BCE_3a_G0011050.mRNA.1.CDS.1 [Saccharomyces cerevisiae]